MVVVLGEFEEDGVMVVILIEEVEVERDKGIDGGEGKLGR